MPPELQRGRTYNQTNKTRQTRARPTRGHLPSAQGPRGDTCRQSLQEKCSSAGPTAETPVGRVLLRNTSALRYLLDDLATEPPAVQPNPGVVPFHACVFWYASALPRAFQRPAARVRTVRLQVPFKTPAGKALLGDTCRAGILLAELLQGQFNTPASFALSLDDSRPGPSAGHQPAELF